MKRPVDHSWLACAPVALAPLVLAFGLSGCGAKPELPQDKSSRLPTAQVRAQSVESKFRPMIEEVVGTVRARLRATLEAKVSGRIDKLPVVLGQRVKAGDLIARVDAAEISARLEQAKAALEQAERDWKRASTLFEQQAITRSEYDAAEARRRISNGAVAEAKAMLSYVEILAPFDGVVTKKWADVGDLAVPGKPLLSMEDPSALQLDADVPDAVASFVKQGSRLTVHVDAIKGNLTGTVSEIAPMADPSSRTLRVKLDLSPTPGLISGQFARVEVPIGESRSLRVPVSAVVQRGQLEMAFVVANQRAQMHLVKTGKRLGDELEILSGLDSGSSVVIDGAAELTDGQPVEIK